MRIISAAIKTLTFALFIVSLSAVAQAQSRTWVSGVGNDANPCSRTAPCKTFAGAIAKTAADGEISVLDPGGYGAVTITKSITIDGTTGAGYGSILASGSNGVVVNDGATATPNTIIVSLRNLSIQGAGTGLDGIKFQSGKVLNVENCIITGFRNSASSDGIEVLLTTSAAATGNQRMLVKNTVIRDNSGSGVRASNSAAGGAVNVTLEGVQVSHCLRGVFASTASRWVIKDSSFNLNTGAGIEQAAGALGVDVKSSMMHSNANGITLAAGTLTISDVQFTNNGTAAINKSGGTLVTYGDNLFAGNGAEIVGGVIPPATNKK